jgi:hypothetical protein
VKKGGKKSIVNHLWCCIYTQIDISEEHLVKCGECGREGGSILLVCESEKRKNHLVSVSRSTFIFLRFFYKVLFLFQFPYEEKRKRERGKNRIGGNFFIMFFAHNFLSLTLSYPRRSIAR